MKICKDCGNQCQKKHKFCISCGGKEFHKPGKAKKKKNAIDKRELKAAALMGDFLDDFDETKRDERDFEEIENTGFTVVSGEESEKNEEHVEPLEKTTFPAFFEESVESKVEPAVAKEYEESLVDQAENVEVVQEESFETIQASLSQTQEPRFWEDIKESGDSRFPSKNRTRNMVLVLAFFALLVGILVYVLMFNAYEPYVYEYVPVAEEYETIVYAEVPDVGGMNFPYAFFVLYDTGFDITASWSYSDTVPEGYVISQTPPAAGHVRLDTPVHLLVSQGTGHIEVASYTGRILSDALMDFEQAGIRYQVEFAHDPVIPAGYIVTNTYGDLPRETRVVIVVSIGPVPVDEPAPTPTPAPAPTVTVNYNPNSGVGFKHPVEVVARENHIVLPNTFAREGHVFVGWNTHPAGGGRSFLPGGTITGLENDMTLFAVWQAAFVPVQRIIDVPTWGRVFAPIPLTGTVYPENATVTHPIIWSVFSDGDTGAIVTGNFLAAINSGTVVLSATVRGGVSTTPNIDFTEFFLVQIDGVPPAIVGPISHRATFGLGGTLQINTVGEATGFALGGNVPFGVGINDNGLLTWTATTPRGAHSFWITARNRYGTSAPFTVSLIIE